MTEISAAQIEDHIKRPVRHDVKEIKVLRANGELPINKQIGATCGIYALDAAFQIRGLIIAPRRQATAEERYESAPRGASIRQTAKAMRLSKIGEISSVDDMRKLANETKGVAHVVDKAASLGVAATIETFYSQQELWTLIVDAINKDHAIVMPYSCAGDDGSPAWSYKIDGFAHWCLLFGYVQYSMGYQRVFMTTYGRYHEVAPYSLFKSNQRIQDWPQQTWIKLFYWCKDPKDPEPDFYPWKAEWLAERTAVETIAEYAKHVKKESNLGLGFGTLQHMLHTLIDPPSPTPNLNFSAETVRRATVKWEDLQRVLYTNTFIGQCVVI